MRFGFVLSEILVGLRRNTAMTVSVVLVTFVSLVFVGAGALLQLQIGVMKDYWYDRVEVSIFLCTADSETPSCTDGEATAAQREGRRACLHACGGGPLRPPHSRRRARLPAPAERLRLYCAGFGERGGGDAQTRRRPPLRAGRWSKSAA